MYDHGFDKACPSGNHMVNDEDMPERAVQIGNTFEDQKGIIWRVFDIDGKSIYLTPEEQERVVSLEELNNNYMYL